MSREVKWFIYILHNNLAGGRLNSSVERSSPTPIKSHRVHVIQTRDLVLPPREMLRLEGFPLVFPVHQRSWAGVHLHLPTSPPLSSTKHRQHPSERRWWHSATADSAGHFCLLQPSEKRPEILLKAQEPKGVPAWLNCGLILLANSLPAQILVFQLKFPGISNYKRWAFSCCSPFSRKENYLLVTRFCRQIKFAVGTEVLYIVKCSQACFLVVLLG